MVNVSGIGSWPGVDVRGALRTIRDQLADLSVEGVRGMPYLPELPACGPGADMVGRTAHLLIDLPVDLQPQGWRLVDRAGLDASRTASLWREDLDELAEAFEGWTGELKLQVAGPWTLAAALWLPQGERVLSDTGAVRELTASLVAGVVEHVGAVQRLLPAASLVVQVDEPSLARVLRGQVPSASGYRRLPAPDAEYATVELRSVLDAASEVGAVRTAVHCCAATPSLRVMREARPGALSVDVTDLDVPAWEELATAVESGLALWAGALAIDGEPSAEGESARAAHESLLRRWREVGLPVARLAEMTVTPACGLAGLTPAAATELTEVTVRLARELAETAAG